MRQAALLLVLAAIACAAHAEQAGPDPGLVVLVETFSVAGDQGKYDWIGQAIQQTMQAELARYPQVRVVGNIVVKRQEAGQQPATLPAAPDFTASLIRARQEGASHLIVGLCQVVDGQLRVTGQVLEVSSCQIVGYVKATGPVSDLLNIEDALADQARQILGLRAAAEGRTGWDDLDAGRGTPASERATGQPLETLASPVAQPIEPAEAIVSAPVYYYHYPGAYYSPAWDYYYIYPRCLPYYGYRSYIGLGFYYGYWPRTRYYHELDHDDRYYRPMRAAYPDGRGDRFRENSDVDHPAPGSIPRPVEERSRFEPVARDTAIRPASVGRPASSGGDHSATEDRRFRDGSPARASDDRPVRPPEPQTRTPDRTRSAEAIRPTGRQSSAGSSSTATRRPAAEARPVPARQPEAARESLPSRNASSTRLPEPRPAPRASESRSSASQSPVRSGSSSSGAYRESRSSSSSSAGRPSSEAGRSSASRR